MIEHEGALVLFSGGQDSTTCLAWALEQFGRVETIGFRYGQRHSVELECRTGLREQLTAQCPAWKRRLGHDHILDLSVLGEVSDTALTSGAEISFSEDGLPNTFVPGRNLLFFTLAAAVGYRRRLRHLVGGMCETDFSGYPDCRDDAIKALQVALTIGMDQRFVLHTPLMWINKAETWRLAERLGGRQFVETIRQSTHTCYLGNRERYHDWGYGCGECPACRLREEGWQDYAQSPGPHAEIVA